MQLIHLIGKGYFPKELPPAFYTETFAGNISTIEQNWNAIYAARILRQAGESNNIYSNRKSAYIKRYSSSKSCEYSISKGKFSRRNLKIPNPKHFLELAKIITNEWVSLSSFYLNSPYSTSYPVEEILSTGRAVKTKSENVQQLRESILESSINSLFQVKLDISKFYPTIYTHIISWSFLGKSLAKEYFKKSKAEIEALINRGDQVAAHYVMCDQIDRKVRACQDYQSVGLPIGPDTSHIISEIVACRLDIELRDKFSHIDFQAKRYYDDYYIFINSRDDADTLIKGIQKILNEYQLEINDKKIEINEFPIAFEEKWVTDLHRFEFKKTNINNSIKHYFSLLWSIGEDNFTKTDWVFKYALRRFELGGTIIPKKSWKIFENLLLKTSLIQPAILDITCRILLTYASYLDDDSKSKIKNLINKVIKDHAQVNHNFEIAWALWIAKSFELKIESEIAKIVIEMNDSISILTLLCLDKRFGLVNGTVNYSFLEATLRDNILFSENWLVAYQGVKNGWLSPAESNLIDNNDFMKILSDLDVNFFNCERQLSTFFNLPDNKHANVVQAPKQIDLNTSGGGISNLS